MRCIVLLLAMSLSCLAAQAQALLPVESSRPIPAAKRAQMEALRTTDPAELRKRWGALAQLMGKVWIANQHTLNGVELHWVIEGAVAQFTSFHCGATPCTRRSALIHYKPASGNDDAGFDIEWADRDPTRGMVIDDDFYVFFSALNTARFVADPSTGVVKFGGIVNHVATDEELRTLEQRGVALVANSGERRRLAEDAQRRAAEAQQQAAQARTQAQAAADAKLLEERQAREARQREEQVAREAKLREELAQKARAQAEAEAKQAAQAQAWQRQRDALAKRFPPIAAGETKTPVLAAAAGGKPKPAIHYLRNDQRAKLRVEVVSSSFAPLLAVYEVDKEEPLASADAAVGAPARLSVSVAGDTAHYVVVVQSVGGKPGAYALKIDRE